VPKSRAGDSQLGCFVSMTGRYCPKCDKPLEKDEDLDDTVYFVCPDSYCGYEENKKGEIV